MIIELPFGLVLKWHEKVRLEEVTAMRMVRAAGMPVPYVLCCGEHKGHFCRVSILMTRLPGVALNNRRNTLVLEDEGPWVGELKECLEAMRTWKSPFGSKRISSVVGRSIVSPRVPIHKMGPFESEEEMNGYLLSPAPGHAYTFTSPEAFQETLARARKLGEIPHRIIFT